MKWFYRCYQCGAHYDLVPGRYLCDVCVKKQQADRPLEGVLELAWEGVPDPGGIPLPVEPPWFPPIPVGNTPLWAPKRLREHFGAPNLWLKDDTCNPSGSSKDRASWLVAAFARQHGLHEIVLASTGNAASSMAAVGAAAGLKIKVFLPANAPVAKRIQVLQYGAELVSVDGNYDLAFDLSRDYSDRTGALSRNTAYNPLTIEGKKTVAFEIINDLARADAKAPDHVFVPVGDGVILAGVYRGFENLLELGRIVKIPTLWACQAQGSGHIGPDPDATIQKPRAQNDPRAADNHPERVQRHGEEPRIPRQNAQQRTEAAHHERDQRTTLVQARPLPGCRCN